MRMRAAVVLAAAAILAACGGVRVSSQVRERATGTARDYAREDPDARGMAATPDGACWEKKEGRLTLALCPAPEKVFAGAAVRLALVVEERMAGKDVPSAGAAVTAEFRHRGQNVPRERDLIHPEPIVGIVREASPGRYEIPVTFPVAGKWTAEFRVVFPDGRDVRTGFTVAIESAGGGGVP